MRDEPSTPVQIKSAEQLECLLCDKKFNGPESKTQHLLSEKHKKKVQEKKETVEPPNKVIEGAKSNATSLQETLECLPCGKTFTGVQSKREHFESEKHLKKVREVTAPQGQYSPVLKNAPKTSAGGDGVQEKSQSGKQNEKDLYCEVCQKPFSGPQSKEEHLRSEKHLRKVSVAVLGSSPLQCLPCNKVFSGQHSLDEHLRSKKHFKMIEV